MKLRIGDMIIALVVISLGVMIWAFPLFGGENGGFVEIKHEDKVKTLSLSVDASLSVGGCDILIEKAKVKVSDATCPDHVCIKTGEIHRAGQSIVCVPNKVSIKITGEGEFDALAG